MRTQLQHQAEEAVEQKAIISSLIAGQTQQGTPTSSVSLSRQSARLPDPPKFDGKLDLGTTFENFLVQVQNKIIGKDDYYPTERIKVIYIAGLLQGNALALVSPRLNPNHGNHYQFATELYTHLEELYADPNRAQNARAEFKRLYMKKNQTF